MNSQTPRSDLPSLPGNPVRLTTPYFNTHMGRQKRLDFHTNTQTKSVIFLCFFWVTTCFLCQFLRQKRFIFSLLMYDAANGFCAVETVSEWQPATLPQKIFSSIKSLHTQPSGAKKFPSSTHTSKLSPPSLYSNT